jgi:hypothetical protein
VNLTITNLANAIIVANAIVVANTTVVANTIIGVNVMLVLPATTLPRKI